jgi:DNA-binding transcriptional LysR family regulator
MDEKNPISPFGTGDGAGQRVGPGTCRPAASASRMRAAGRHFIDQTVTFWILWPASRYASPKLRVFIDNVSKNLQI